MRSLRPLALGAVLLATLPAFAQDAFPDVPRNHWAYATLARMKKDGLLVGYPDGLYRGGRPMSRYELAVALHAAYTNLKNRADGIDAQIRALQNFQALTDVQALKDATEYVRTQLLALRGMGADLADLQRGADTFELELNQLGVDTQAMKDELRSLAGRVQALEAKKAPLEIGGRIDLWAGGGYTDGDHYGLTRDGRITGTTNKGPVGSSAATDRAGITDDLAFLHELAFDFATTNATGPKVKGTVVATNAFGQSSVDGAVTTHVGFGNQSDVFNPSVGSSANLYGYAEGSGDLYLQELTVSFSGRRGDLEAGRVRYESSPWILRRIDNTLYFDDPRWDDGKYTFDGAVGRTRLGPFRAEAYGGTSHDQSVKGVEIDPLRSLPTNGPYGSNSAIGQRLEADRLLGTTLATDGRNVGLRGDYLILDSDAGVVPGPKPFDQLHVYGGEADAHLGRLKLTGGLRHSVARSEGARVDGLAGSAWDAKLAYASGRFDAWVQGREIQTNYLAPGDWGRLGVLRDPTNLRGGLGHLGVALTPRLDLGLEGEIDHGLSSARLAVGGTELDRGTDIGRYALHLNGRFGGGWEGSVYYENTLFHDLGANDASVTGPAPQGGPALSYPDARYQWYGVGVARALGANARFSLLYEQSAIRHDYQTSIGEGYRGGFLVSQVTVKF